ncbi:unnamed protein product, partial [Symbiodinium pilosum]
MSRRRAVPAAAPTLIDGACCSELNFAAAFENLDNYVYFVVYGDDGNELGCAVAEILNRFERDSEGAYLELKYLGCSDGYYRWYFQHEGQRGGLPRGACHHLCRRHVTRCSRANSDPKVIHIQKWSPVSRQEASDLLEGWGDGLLPSEPVRPPASSPASTTKAKTKAKKPSGQMSLPAPVEEVDDGEEEAEAEEDEPQVPSRPPLKRRRRKPAKVAALDAMLDEPEEDYEQAAGVDSQAEQRLQLLRRRLQGKKEETKTSKSPAAVLAQRASSAAEGSRKRKPRENVLKALGRALVGKSRGSRDVESEEDSEFEDDTDEDGYELAKGDWQAKRRRLRKIADERPGHLLARTLASLHEQLAATTGEESKDPLAPIMAIDLVLRGKIDSAADVMVQRVKSILMTVRDGSSQCGQYLELIPDHDSLGVSFEESSFAREQ